LDLTATDDKTTVPSPRHTTLTLQDKRREQAPPTSEIYMPHYCTPLLEFGLDDHGGAHPQQLSLALLHLLELLGDVPQQLVRIRYGRPLVHLPRIPSANGQASGFWVRL